MISNQFRIYLCYFHCSHRQNHLLNFTFREKGPLVLVKTTFSSLFRNKLPIPHANCNGHAPFDMFHHICPQNDTLGFLGENILVSSIGRCATLGYTAVPLRKHAYSNILKILPPKKKKKNQIKNLIFSYFCSKRGLWRLVRTASPMRFQLVPTIYVLAKWK